MQRTLWATTWCNTLNAAFTLAITSSGHAHLCVPSENAWWQTDLSLLFWLHFPSSLHLHAADGHNSWFSNTCFLPLNDACPQTDVGSSSWGCHCICEEALSRAFLPNRGPDGSVSMHYCAPDLLSDQASQDMNVQVRGACGGHVALAWLSVVMWIPPVCIWCCGPFTRWAKEWLVPITVLFYLHAITPYTSLLQHRSTL